MRDPAIKGLQRRTMRKTLLLGGIVAVGLYALGDLVSGLVHDGYSFKDQAISELTAIGAPSRPLMVTVITVHTLLGIGFAAAVWQSADRNRALRWAGGILFAAGAVAIFLHPFAPLHGRGVEPSLTDTMHRSITVAWSLAIFAAVALSAVAYRGWFRLFSIATLIVLPTFGYLAASLDDARAADLATPEQGLFERINAYTLFAWIVVLAVVLLRAQRSKDANVVLITKGSAARRARAFVKRHSVPIYYALTFAISWAGILKAVGPDDFLGSGADIATIATVSLAGPSIAGVVLTASVEGRAGLRRLVSRLGRWRVGARWYAVALLTGPLVMGATAFAFSLADPDFRPDIATADDKLGVVLAAIAGGLAVGFFEELGWTGFAMPRLRRHYDVLATGVVMGVLWGAWHFPMFAGETDPEGRVPAALLVATFLFAWLPPYRVLMVWVYDRTESLLLAMLMHAPISATAIILISSATPGAAAMIKVLVWGAAFWAIVAVAAWANGGRLTRQEKRMERAPEPAPARVAVG